MSRQHTRVRSGRGSSKQTPAAPTGLTATPTGQTTIHLDWATPYSGTVKTVALSGWKVYRSETSGSGFSLRSTVVASEYDDTAIVGTRYYYKVTAVGLDAESAYSSEVSAITQGDYQAPAWTIPDLVGVDANFGNIVKGGYADLTSYYSANDGTPVFSIQSITAAGGSDTSGITINPSTGRISVSETTPADGYTVVVDLAEPSTTITTLGISGAGAWTFGQAFKQGDAPAYVAVSGGQADVRNRWSDGSVKFAVLSGISTGAGSVSITTSASDSMTGTALTLTQMRSALTGSITVGTQTVNLATMVAAAPQRTVATGPVMSNWIFRQALSVGTDMSLWVDVRYYSNGTCEVFPWVENGYLFTASPTNYVGTCSVTVNGATTSLGAIDFKARTRVPLLTGTDFAYRTSGSALTPTHDVAYLRASKLVPNYGWTSPNSATLDALQQSYTPNTLAGISSTMTAAGGSAAIINTQQALYFTSGDARAYRALVTFGLSGGSWSVHYRDSATQEPFRFTDWPSVSINDGGSPAVVAAGGSGGTNGTPGPTHEPSFGFAAYLVTGREWFLDEHLFWCGYNYICATPSQRRGMAFSQNTSIYPAYAASGSAGVCDGTNGAYTPRGAAWSLSKIAQALAVLPDTHAHYASIKQCWEANVGFYHAVYVTGTHARDASEPTRVGSVLGYTGEYGNPYGNATYWGGSGWMFGMFAQVIGHSYEMELPQVTTTEHGALLSHCAKWPVGLAGGVGGWNYRRFSQFSTAIGNGTTFSLYSSWATALAADEAWKGLAALPATAGLTLVQHGGNTDLQFSPYFGQQWAALVYAKDHGVSGAEAGYTNVTGAPNFSTVAAGFNNDPAYGIAPR